jgi:hypothetical protein
MRAVEFHSASSRTYENNEPSPEIPLDICLASSSDRHISRRD